MKKNMNTKSPPLLDSRLRQNGGLRGRKTVRFAVSGDKGSFSEEAAQLYLQRAGLKAALVYLLDMEGVLQAVEEKSVDMGIFPVVNMRGGLVSMAFEAMGKHVFTPVDDFWLDVQQCLLVKPGVKLQQIKKVVSHPQALAQCERFLLQECKNAELVPWQDTAKAARDLGAGKLSRFTAVIAPQRSARLYKLEVLAKSIQDNHPNLTAFIVVTQR